MTGPIEPTVVWLTWRQLFARRRLYLAAAFSLMPFLVAVVFRFTASDVETASVGFLMTLLREVVIGTLLPLAAIVFGTTAFGGEIDDGTLVYLLVKPIARWRVVLSKYLVAVACTAAVMVPAIFLPWLLVRNAGLPVTVPLAFAAGAGAGTLVYCALFVMLGLTLRRSLVVGLIYVIGLEIVLSRSIVGLRSLSIREFAFSVTEAVGKAAVPFVDPVVAMTTVWTVGTVILVGSIGYSMRRLTRYEVAERL
jgi:ABC-2 type transport system permease protein